jgi:hypothetical protein
LDEVERTRREFMNAGRVALSPEKYAELEKLMALEPAGEVK